MQQALGRLAATRLEPGGQARTGRGPLLAWSGLAALQWLAFMATNSFILPVLAGQSLGLDPPGVASLVERTFVLTGTCSLLQLLYGHRLPISDGPAGVSFATFLALTEVARATGLELDHLRAQLQAGVLAGGVVVAALGLAGVTRRAERLLTPIAMGTFSVLMPLQVSGPFLRGILGIGYRRSEIDWPVAALALGVMALVWYLSGWGRGLGRGLSVLIGLAVGWLLFWLLDLVVPVRVADGRLWALPDVWAWGQPVADTGVLLLSLATSLGIFVNTVTAIWFMARAVGTSPTPHQLGRGMALTGVGNMLAGFGATVGPNPYVSTASFVELTGLTAKGPFVLAAVLTMLLGLIPVLGSLWAALPVPLGYAVLLPSWTQMVGMGLREYKRLQFSRQETLIVGVSLFVGVGIMLLPSSAMITQPLVVRQLLGNSAVSGTVLAVVLEQVVRWLGGRRRATP